MTSNLAKRFNRPEWADCPGLRTHRVDPAFIAAGRSFEIGRRSYGLDARGVVIEREDGVAVALRPNAFTGVAARAEEDAEGRVTVTLELLHADPQLCVPLLIANDLDHVAGDWREWSRLLSLPMLMVEADGSVSTLEVEPRSSDRRRRASRRPRFLMRRATGSALIAMRIEGVEIIARR